MGLNDKVVSFRDCILVMQTATGFGAGNENLAYLEQVDVTLGIRHEEVQMANGDQYQQKVQERATVNIRSMYPYKQQLLPYLEFMRDTDSGIYLGLWSYRDPTSFSTLEIYTARIHSMNVSVYQGRPVVNGFQAVAFDWRWQTANE